MNKEHYVLLEGLPGAGKSTLINFLRLHNCKFSLIPDFGNPKDLSNDFKIDFSWIIDIESQKSRLALRPIHNMVLQERGFLSILACHYMLEKLNQESTYHKVLNEIKRRVEDKQLIVPQTIIISTISPEISQKNQPGTKLEMWRNSEKLKLIQEYYIQYSNAPLFGEKIISVDWTQLQQTCLNNWSIL